MLSSCQPKLFAAAEQVLAEAKAAGKALQDWAQQQQVMAAVKQGQEENELTFLSTELHESWSASEIDRSAEYRLWQPVNYLASYFLLK